MCQEVPHLFLETLLFYKQQTDMSVLKQNRNRSLVLEAKRRQSRRRWVCRRAWQKQTKKQKIQKTIAAKPGER